MRWLYALIVVFVPSLTAPIFADDDDRGVVNAESAREPSGDTVTLARLERERVSTDTRASARRVPLFELLAPTEDEIAPPSRNRPPVGWGVIPLPPLDDWQPRDSRLRPSELPFDESEARARVLRERSTVGDGFFHTDLIAELEPPRNRHMEVFQRLATKVAFRHLRRLFRAELKDRFQDDPSFDYYDYLEQRREIGRLGRPDMTTQDVSIEEILESARSDAHDDEDTFERDIPLLDWGPLQLSDRGQLKLGYNRLASDQTSSRVKLALEENEEGAPPPPTSRSLLFGRRTWRFDADLKFRPDVRELGRGGYRELLGKVKATAEIDFYTAMLQRKYMSTEFEISVDEENRASFFVNLVIYGR